MDLKVTFIQTDLAWESPYENLENFSKKINAMKTDTDLIVLPEMFTTGFTMNAEKLAENTEGPTLQWMKKIATESNLAITGSVIIQDEEKYYNRLYFVFPDGNYEHYDKRHTFTLAGEHKTYTAGTQKLIVELKGWRICLLICYDLRFPVWSRNVEDYDFLIYVANWPKRRIAAWDALLKARAIENMSYCLGVNRIGLDGNQHEYSGHTALYDVMGEQLSRAAYEQDFIETITLSKEHLKDLRSRLQFLNDRDKFTLE